MSKLNSLLLSMRLSDTIHISFDIGKTWKDQIRDSTQFKSSIAWGEMYSWLVLSSG